MNGQIIKNFKNIKFDYLHLNAITNICDGRHYSSNQAMAIKRKNSLRENNTVHFIRNIEYGEIIKGGECV